MGCANCGAENRPDAKFCGECGRALAATCPACGAANEAGRRFCYECGSPLASDVPPATPAAESTSAAASPAPAPVAERRLVSVLFADLVGFTPLSGVARRRGGARAPVALLRDAAALIERYGGTVEKFIGDAVMAVWGAPVARRTTPSERCAPRSTSSRRSTRSARRSGRPGCEARAGVLTGEAAVTLGAVGEGMVAGDLVNTASRIQSAAEPGTVLVGESTKRATEAAIAYEDAGSHELKGKAEPVPLWRALRVVGRARRGAARSARPGGAVRRARPRAAPGQGAVPRLRRGAARRSSSRSTGIAGHRQVAARVGVREVHRRARRRTSAGIAAAASPTARASRTGRSPRWCGCAAASSRTRTRRRRCAKLRATIERAHPRRRRSGAGSSRASRTCSGSRRAPAGDQENLFSAWRILFERLAEQSPTILVFEDMQWADVEPARLPRVPARVVAEPPLFVLVARPPRARRQAALLGRGQAQLHLALPGAALAAGDGRAARRARPRAAGRSTREAILERAEGVPLYAVETVRMLLDRGLLTRRATSTGRPARSRRSRCPRRSTR